MQKEKQKVMEKGSLNREIGSNKPKLTEKEKQEQMNKLKIE